MPELRQLLEQSAGTPRSWPSAEQGWRQGQRLRRRRQAAQTAVAGVAALALAVPAVGWWSQPRADGDQAAVTLQPGAAAAPSPAAAPLPVDGPPELNLPASLQPVLTDGGGAGAEGMTVQRYRDVVDPDTALSLIYARPDERRDPAALLEDLRAGYAADLEPDDAAELEGGSTTFAAPTVERVEVGGLPGYLITLEEQAPAQRVLVWVDAAGAAVHLGGTGDLDLLTIAGAQRQS